MEMKCSTPCDEGGSTFDALATSGNSSRMTLPKEPGGKAMNLGRAGGWSAAMAVTALVGWPLWLQPGWEAGTVSIACTCESVGQPTGVAVAIAEVSAGSGWLRTLETVGRSWVEMVSTRRFAAGSTKSLKCLNKSTPIIGNCTLASRNSHTKRRPWKERDSRRSPQQGMCNHLHP